MTLYQKLILCYRLRMRGACVHTGTRQGFQGLIYGGLPAIMAGKERVVADSKLNGASEVQQIHGTRPVIQVFLL